MAGLFDYGVDPKELEKQKQNDMGLLGLLVGGSILAGNQPGSTMGQALGQGMTTGAQGYMTLENQRTAQMMKQRQLAMAAAKPTYAPAGSQPQVFDPTAGKYVNSGPPTPGRPDMGKPAAPIQNFAHRQKLVEQYGEGSQQIKTFDNYVRALPYLNTGPQFVQPGIAGSQTPPNTVAKGLNPGDQPSVRREQSYAAGEGRGRGAEDAAAAIRATTGEAALPQLTAAVDKLKELGSIGTYTTAGQIRDTILRETGQPMSDGGKARAAYVAHVANNVLPLLRQTFGAAFTAAEGESLKATLGEPNMSPEEKNAVLDAFIEDKKATLGTHRREAGGANSQPQPSAPGASAPRRKFNPATGGLE